MKNDSTEFKRENGSGTIRTVRGGDIELVFQELKNKRTVFNYVIVPKKEFKKFLNKKENVGFAVEEE